MEKTNAISIANFIKHTILQLGFDNENLQFQCYDGCATILGKKKEVATQIKNGIQPLAISTHCHAHSLNWACGSWISNTAFVSKSLDTSYEITELVKFYPKLDSHFQKIDEEEYYKIEENCSSKFTTSTVRADPLTSIYKNYLELEELWR